MSAMVDDAAGVTVSRATTRPILPSADLRVTAEFYAGFGFQVLGHWPHEYLILCGPDDIELHFWLDPDVNRWTNDVGCWIGYPYADAVRARHAAWSRVAVPAPGDLKPITSVVHLIEFQLIDVHGNLLRFGAPAEAPAAVHGPSPQTHNGSTLRDATLQDSGLQGSGKYARVERERRFILAGPPPPGLVTQTRQITDRYLDGTRLRLRSVLQPRAGGPSYKLTQKIPGERPGEVSRGVQGLITSTYLSEPEFAALAGLPGVVLSKTRHSVPPFGVDVFEGQLAGLVLAEAEFDSDDACAAFEPPLDGRVRIIAEVTADPRFTGGQLAVTTAAELAACLDEFGLLPR